MTAPLNTTGAPEGTRAVLRCPGCGATVTAWVQGGRVRNTTMAHDDRCSWLRAIERGVAVAPVQVEGLGDRRP